MADTPLELYEEAYRLHYHEKKIADAVKIYEMIIRDFPDSNECGYAFIQLQKVKANDISKMLRKGPSALYPMIIVSFVMSLIALTIGIVGNVFIFQQLRQEHQRSTLAMIALGKMFSGSDEYALKIIGQMKAAAPADPLAYELTSAIISNKKAAARAAPPRSADTARPSVAASAPPAKPPAARTKAVAPPPRRTSTTKPARNPIIYGTDSVSYF